jgi:SH3 domain protein
MLFLFAVPAAAETLYVTDRILLGVHQEASETSPLIQTIPSGTPVTVVMRNDDFVEVRLADGTEGWVSAAYLKKEKPATVELDALHVAHKKLQDTNADLKQQIAKLERELQIKRDQYSNAQTTIEELKKNKGQNTQTASAPSDADVAKTEEELASAKQTIDELKGEIEKLKQQNDDAEQVDQTKLNEQLADIKQDNKALQARIEMALASLQGEKLPSPQELAAIRPVFPFWYWLLLAVALIVGAIVGILWLDQRHRRRHGGFRV